MRLKATALILLLIFTGFSYLSASEVVNGYLRLIINESTGRYLIYFLSNPNSSRYEALFSSEDPATSYATILMDGKVYRLGGKYFKTRLEKQSNGFPSFVFEGENLTVTQSFTPIKSANSKHINSLLITYKIQNTGSEEAATGLRILIDTFLSEKLSNNFLTGEQIVKNETLLEGHSGERFWISRGKNTALMGSIINPVDPNAKTPDYIHFANWKRLNDAPWKIKYVKKRSFTNAPFSINDAAVCYYFDPQVLSPGREFTYSIVLSTEDIEWYNSLNVSAPPLASAVPPAAKAASPAKSAPAASSKQTPASVPSPAPTPSVSVPDAAADETPIYILPTISIKEIELDSLMEAYESGEDVNVITLRKFQEILKQFVDGEIVLNETDIIELENAIDRYR